MFALQIGHKKDTKQYYTLSLIITFSFINLLSHITTLSHLLKKTPYLHPILTYYYIRAPLDDAQHNHHNITDITTVSYLLRTHNTTIQCHTIPQY